MTTSWLTLKFPREVTTTQGLATLLALNGLSSPRRNEYFVLEAVGRADGVRHRLRVPEKQRAAVVRQLTTHLPGIAIEDDEKGSPAVSRSWRAWQSTSTRSLTTDQPEVEAHGLLAALSSAEGDEVITMRWMLGPVRRPQAVGNQVTGSYKNLMHGVAVGAVIPPADLDAEARKALRNKQSLPGWRAVLHLGVKADGLARERQLLGQLAAAVRVAQGQGVELGFNGFRPRLMSELRQPWRWNLTINVAELLGLTAWPLGDTSHLPVPRVRSRSLPAPSAIPRSGLVIGESSYGSERRAMAVGVADSRMHTHLIGATGSGKSTLMLNLITQVMESGQALCLIEPKGDLIRDVLARIPDHRLDDVVLIDPTDDRPVGLNPLHQPGVAAEVITDQILAVFKGLFGEAIGPRTQDLLTAGLLTLTAQPNMSLVALPLLYTDANFRQRLISGLTDRLSLGPFWAWYDGLSSAERAAVLAPLMNKARHLLLRPRLRRVIGQAEPRFDVRDLYFQRRIVLVNLNKGLLGPESASLLGSIALSMIWQATLARSAIAPEKRHTTYLFLDEFADFVHLPQDFSDVLTTARGLGTAVIAAHQHLAQLSSDLRAAVLANARNRIVMNTSLDDAAVLVKGDGRLKADDVASLGRYEAYARLLVDNEPQPFASIRTLPSLLELRPPEDVAERSRALYGVPAGEVDAALEDLAGIGASDSTRPSKPGRFGIKKAEKPQSNPEEG